MLNRLTGSIQFQASTEEWKECLKNIDNRLKNAPQDFGRGQLYQAHEDWGIPGQRPTLERIRNYQLRSAISKESKILDIGCNIGLFGAELSPYIQSYIGIDINKELIDIANLIKKTRKITNCEYKTCDFLNFSQNQKEATFDLVLSFAVHVWIGLPPQDYANLLYKIVTPEGHLLLESNSLHSNDKYFFENVKYFEKSGFIIINQGIIKDDGIIERGFYLLKKTKNILQY